MRIIGLAGWSGAGKTTLIERVLPVQVEHGIHKLDHPVMLRHIIGVGEVDGADGY